MTSRNSVIPLPSSASRALFAAPRRAAIVVGMLALVGSLAAVSCKGDSKKAKDDSPAKPVETIETPATIEARPLGVESPRAFSYVWGKGAKSFKKAEGLLKAEARDWSAVSAACNEAIAADKNHLGAHRLLGIALANQGQLKKAAEHLSTALAADWLRWGPDLAEDKSLKEFFSTPEGKALLDQNEKYKASFEEMTKASVMVVARRTKWKRPKKLGKQWAATRAELFGYHLDDERYLRLTHTGESVVGTVLSPSGDRLAFLAVTHYEFGEEGLEPLIATARVGVLDTATWKQVGKSARIKKPSLSLALYYGAGEELLLDTGKTVFSVDFEGGKLKKSSASSLIKGVGDWAKIYADGGRSQTVLYANSELARLLTPWNAVVKSAKEIVVGDDKKSIVLPDAGGTTIRRVAWSPDKAHLTFVGVGDACSKDHQAALYVADAKTGSLKHVHRGAGLGESRWIDANRFIFESEPGELRVYDASTNDTTHTIKNRSGLALSAMSNVTAGEHCATAKPAPTEGAGPDEEPDGPQEPGDSE